MISPVMSDLQEGGHACERNPNIRSSTIAWSSAKQEVAPVAGRHHQGELIHRD